VDLASRLIRDLLLIGVGVIAFIVTPPSVEEAGIYGPLSKVWALMIGLGAAVSLVGVIRSWRRWEIYGCSFVGGGFLVWAFAAFTLPHLTLTAVAVALVFLALTAGQFFRVGVISERARSKRQS
jgi:hypothetical protein